MKSCIANRKLIVWQTLNALDAQQNWKLQAHLETCADCRRYLAEMSNLTEKLTAVEANPDLQASASFHRNVAQKLRTAKPVSLAEILASFIQRPAWNWRVAVPAAIVLALMGLMLATRPQPPGEATHLPAVPSSLVATSSGLEVAPTIANYQRTADQSWEQLDALLARQSKRALPTRPSYTAETHSLANELF